MHPLSRVLLLVTLLTLTFNGSAQQSSTTVPNLIRYGGVLKDAQGAAVASHTVGITFLIYGQQDGGAPVWLETQNVATDAAGQYSVLLGSTTATGLPSDLFWQQEQRWLGVQVQCEPEQARVRLVSVPYAMNAAEADKLAGHSASEFVTTDNLQSAVQQQLQGHASTAPSVSSSATDSRSNKSGMNNPVVTNPATNFVGNTANQIVLVQQNGTGVGLRASSPNNVGVLGTVSSTAKAGIVAGVEGTSTINNGYGVFGYSTAASGGIGAQGRSDSSNGIGLRGFTVGTSGVAVNALSSATSGTPVGLLSSISAPGGTGALITNSAAGTITGPLIAATTNAGTQFTVGANGNVKFGGNLATLSIGSAADHNLFLGVGVGASNVAGQGTWNNFFGYQSGLSNTSGNANTFSGYQSGALNTTGHANVFTGYQAGYSNTTGSNNTFSGAAAGFSNTTGYYNTFSGDEAGYWNTTGHSNAFYGRLAGAFNDSGSYNTFSGFQAGYSNITGYANTFSGYGAGAFNDSGSHNTFSGNQAGYSNTTGGANTFSGDLAGYSNTTGSSNTFYGYLAGNQANGNLNTFIGYQAGYNSVSGIGNTYISSKGNPNGTTSESYTIRIGSGLETAAYIAGIYGTNIGSGTAVYVNSTGQLGTLPSSLRFKESVRDMGDSTNALMMLRPVTFRYKPEYDKGPRTLQYGLIAEEVAEVYPELVAYEEDGQPYTVKYHYLATMLLNEVQKQYRRAEDEAEVNKTQQQEISELKAQLRLQNAAFQERLERLESMAGAQTQVDAIVQSQNGANE